MNALANIVKAEIWHKEYNLGQRDTMNELPSEKAVFGIFAIINDEVVNCRYTGESENLRLTIQGFYESGETGGLRKFMQGPWLKVLLYKLMPGSSKEERQRTAEEWTQKHKPGIDADGEHPGYY